MNDEPTPIELDMDGAIIHEGFIPIALLQRGKRQAESEGIEPMPILDHAISYTLSLMLEAVSDYREANPAAKGITASFMVVPEGYGYHYTYGVAKGVFIDGRKSQSNVPNQHQSHPPD